jgi:nucleoside-diphosphate-sugar epimerase
VIVAVTGATGYLGYFLLHALARDGITVRAWRRRSSDLTGLPDGIEWIEGDLGSRDSMRALVEGADALVHAALDHAPGRYRGGEGGDLAASLMKNVGGGLALLAEAQAAGLARAIVASSRAALDGHVAEGLVGDDALPAPTTHYGAAKAALEAFGASFSADGFPVAAIRPTGIYGFRQPPEKSKWWDLVGQALRGETVPARSATEVHGADVAMAVLALLAAPAERIAGRAFNLSDMVVSNREILELVQKEAGVAGPLPEAGPLPRVTMRCDAIAALGVRFGGRALLENTVKAIVAARRD